ncbi:hypothetical protein ZWY2020_024933 [Hordeum vulgare]|nr:hypothetical protein ZWY2020_024933 [Hordeum vulgare]
MMSFPMSCQAAVFEHLDPLFGATSVWITKEFCPNNSFFEQSNFVGDAKRSFSFLTNSPRLLCNLLKSTVESPEFLEKLEKSLLLQPSDRGRKKQVAGLVIHKHPCLKYSPSSMDHARWEITLTPIHHGGQMSLSSTCQPRLHQPESYGMFIGEPSTQLATMRPTANTMIASEPGEHVGTSNGIYPFEMTFLQLIKPYNTSRNTEWC